MHFFSYKTRSKKHIYLGKMKHTIFFIFIFVTSSIHSQNIDRIEDYYALCNSIKSETEIKLQNSIFVLNGKLVEDIINGPYGYLYFQNKNDEEDSLMFFHRCNYMVFQKNKYMYMIDCLRKNGFFTGGESDQFNQLIKMRFFIYDNNAGKYYTYSALFPVSWTINHNEQLFFNTSIRITSLTEDNYMMSISTYGRYWSFNIEGNNTKKIKRKLIKKHKKLYGHF